MNTESETTTDNQTTPESTPDTTPADSTDSVLDDGRQDMASDDSAPADATQPDADTNQETSPEGEGDAPPDDSPDWFMKDKFQSIDEQARAYPELQKKMGKFWGAPADNYQVEGIEGITKDDPLLENLMPALKEVGLSQEGFAHLVKQYQEANVQMMKKYEEELKKELTTNDAANYNAVDKWMTQNLTPEERDQIQQNWLMTPKDFKLFNQLRLMAAPSTSVPSGADNNAPRFESSNEVENDKIKYRKEIREGIRVADKNYENELAQRFRDARGRELRGK